MRALCVALALCALAQVCHGNPAESLTDLRIDLEEADSIGKHGSDNFSLGDSVDSSDDMDDSIQAANAEKTFDDSFSSELDSALEHASMKALRKRKAPEASNSAGPSLVSELRESVKTEPEAAPQKKVKVVQKKLAAKKTKAHMKKKAAVKTPVKKAAHKATVGEKAGKGTNNAKKTVKKGPKVATKADEHAKVAKNTGDKAQKTKLKAKPAKTTAKKAKVVKKATKKAQAAKKALKKAKVATKALKKTKVAKKSKNKAEVAGSTPSTKAAKAQVSKQKKAPVAKKSVKKVVVAKKTPKVLGASQGKRKAPSLFGISSENELMTKQQVARTLKRVQQRTGVTLGEASAPAITQNRKDKVLAPAVHRTPKQKPAKAPQVSSLWDDLD